MEAVCCRYPATACGDWGRGVLKLVPFVQQTDAGAKHEIDLGYVSASSLEDLNGAKRTSFRQLVGTAIIAPQIFYFEPQRLWYLIAHTKVAGKPNLAPVYLTNPNIDDLQGWSKPQILQTGKLDETFWIDFWIICDDTNAHLFYSNQQGAVLRMECPLKNFPHGFAQSTEQVALSAAGEDDTARWQIFEAQHVYHVKEPDKYLMLLECGYYEKSKHWFGDARSRFMIGMVADRLQGPWTRIEPAENEFLAQAKNLFREDGHLSHYTQISHPELIRSGYNQKLEIENFNLRILFQSFDGSKTPDGYDYNELPWELAVMRNYQ